MSYITGIGTANPHTRLAQPTIAEFMVRAMQLEGDDARKLRALYRATGIEQRHTVIEDYGRIDNYDFYPNTADMEPFPSTKRRLEMYREHAIGLSEQAVRNAVANVAGFKFEEVTHLVVVSCTGMYAPGLDIDLVKALGLPRNVQRSCVKFMGCYAAFNGMKLADTMCRANPNAKVLVVCTELCTIHFQKDKSEDNLLSNALFADGSAAILVESTPRPGLNLKPTTFFCDLALQGEEEMAWIIGDMGFEMKLTSYVPEMIRQGISQLTHSLLGKTRTELSDIDFFAIHPGGRKILEAIESELGLTKEQNIHAYNVLREYGNMSSATVLFVLNDLARSLTKADDHKKVLSFAFGPGLTLESMMLEVEYHKVLNHREEDELELVPVMAPHRFGR